MFSLKKLVLVVFIFSFYNFNSQVTLSADFTNEDNESTALHNIWSIANRISPQNGSNVRPGLKMNTVRMIGGIKKTVNGENVNIPSYALKVGDIVSVRERSKSLEAIANSMIANPSQMEWLEFNSETKLGKVVAAPERIQIPENIKEQLIVELYSK